MNYNLLWEFRVWESTHISTCALFDHMNTALNFTDVLAPPRGYSYSLWECSLTPFRIHCPLRWFEPGTQRVRKRE